MPVLLPDTGGLFVPFLVQEIEATNTAKLILSQILALKDCTATDVELGAMVGVSAKTIANNLTTLRGLGLIESYNREGKRIINADLLTTDWGFWIPAAALSDASLNPTDKVLLGNIHSMGKLKKGCMAGNGWLARIAGVTVGRVKNILTKLRSMGWVKSVENAGKRLLQIAKELAQLPAKVTCTSRKSDGLPLYKNKEKTILPNGENPSFSINQKIEAVILKTGWLKKQVIERGLDAADLAADLLKSGFTFISENAARSYLKDFIGRKSAAVTIAEHPAAAAISERYAEFFHKKPSLSQLQVLLAAADQYGVNKVRYHINILGIGNDITKHNAAGVISSLKNGNK